MRLGAIGSSDVSEVTALACLSAGWSVANGVPPTAALSFFKSLVFVEIVFVEIVLVEIGNAPVAAA
jgi:hypothetical protein